MPYDPTLPAALTDDGALAVQLQGSADEPETVLHLARPAGGVVRVREYPSPGAPRAYDAPVGEVLARVERVARARRRLNVELARVRAWLAGGAGGAA